VQVQLQIDIDVAALQIGEKPFLDPGPGELQIFVALHLRLRQTEALVPFPEMGGLLDGARRGSAPERLRPVRVQDLGVRDRLSEQARFGLVELLGHGVIGSCPRDPALLSGCGRGSSGEPPFGNGKRFRRAVCEIGVYQREFGFEVPGVDRGGFQYDLRADIIRCGDRSSHRSAAVLLPARFPHPTFDDCYRPTPRERAAPKIPDENPGQ
jgi:hypothetical protein